MLTQRRNLMMKAMDHWSALKVQTDAGIAVICEWVCVPLANLQTSSQIDKADLRHAVESRCCKLLLETLELWLLMHAAHC